MKKISNKKKDLELMLDKLNIQVDNPVCIMDQENSKEFIKGSDKDKYKFFSKATNLERVITGLRAIKQDILNMQRMCDHTRTQLEGYAQNLKQAQSDFQHFENIEELDQKIKTNHCKRFWIEVKNQESILEELETEQESLTTVIKERKQLVEKLKTEEVSIRRPEDLVSEIQRLKNDSDEAALNVERLNKEWAKAKKEEKLYENELKSLKTKKSDSISDLKRMSKLIKDTKDENNSKNKNSEVMTRVSYISLTSNQRCS
mmetsp:Transcript_37242/g.48154  ORF Transcript_37242/g.48154 Transcript_37242/m.48154 type:complete len:259 (+) Transcript_37242:1028-1804(+)